MAIAKYKGFCNREYRDSDGWHTERFQVAQFETAGERPKYPKGYYKELWFTTPNSSLTQFGNGVWWYNPGKVYLSKKFFTWKDLFEESDFSRFRQFILDTYNTNPNFNFTNVYPLSSSTKIFAKTPDGFNIFFILAMSCAPANMSSSGYIISRPFMINLEVVMSKYLPEQLLFDSNSGNNVAWTTLDGTRLVPNTDFRGYGMDSTFNTSDYIRAGKGPYTYITPDDLLFYINSFFEALQKVRMYITPYSNSYIFFKDTTIDNVCYNITYYGFEPTKSNYSQPSYWGGIFFDVRDVPGYNEVAFSPIANTDKWGIVEIEWGTGPDANDPYEIEDPNDDDPGHGPGQNPGDSGGDGDHDNTSDEIKPPNKPSISGSLVGLFTIYNPSQSELAQLAQKLWSPDALQAIKQYFTSPMESILGLSIIPVKPTTGELANIHLGMYDTEVAARKVDSDYIIVNCGSIPINRYWGSYLDYDPYTKISCYLPYIGEIDINPDQVMQKTLGVIYYINVVTGDTVAILTADGSIIYTAAGNCVRQLPLSNTDYSAIINTAVSAVSTLAMAAATSGVGNAAIAGAQEAGKSTELLDAKQTANSVGSGGSLIHDVMNAKFHYQHAGAMGTGSGQLSYQTPYLTIERPNLDLADNYKSFVGYPCNKTMALSSCHGFTQIEATRLSISGATDAEIAEITTLLVGGVII